jgi:hypothetical protein
MECSFPFISISDAEEMVRGPEVDFGIDSGLTGCVQEICSEQKRVSILFRNTIEGSIVHTKMKATIFLLDEKNRGTMRRVHRTDKSYG